MNGNAISTVDTFIQVLSDVEKLELIERIARSIRDRSVGRSTEERRAGFQRLCKEMENLPVQNPNDGISNRDHDQLLYGDRG